MAGLLIIGLAARAPYRRRPLSSNVRPLRSLRWSRSGNCSSRPAEGNGALLDPLACPPPPSVSPWAARPLQSKPCALGQRSCCRGPAVQSVRWRRARSRATLARLAYTVAVAVPPFSLNHVAAPGSRATFVLAAIARSTHSHHLGRRGAVGPSRAVHLSPCRRPNHHWSGQPPASRLGREALAVYHPPRGQVVFPASAAQLKR